MRNTFFIHMVYLIRLLESKVLDRYRSLLKVIVGSSSKLVNCKPEAY